ncbi:MAG: hypothetical protein KatS3mg105_3094 [Gemmatales bacterium]|nr:MAG: hypothetical protein KatS3mg105_3094 [Gemmatales bacterium]
MMRHVMLMLGAAVFASGAIGVPGAFSQQDRSGFVDRLFREHDKNKDGYLSKNEIPSTMARVFPRIDRDGDGKLSKSEVAAVADKLERFLGKGKAGGKKGEVNTPPARGERKQTRLKVGDPAPDFSLPDLSGKNEVRLSSFKGKKPVVLIFGSYT